MKYLKKNTLPNLLIGIRPIMEAIQAGRQIERVLIKTDLDGDLFRSLLELIQKHNIPFQFVPIEKLNNLTSATHQGVAAFVSLITYADMEAIIGQITERNETPLILLLDGVTDVRNFGAIARSAECAGVHTIVIPAKGAAPINADALKTSAGALNRIPVCRVPNLRTALYYLKDSGIQIVAATEKAPKLVYDCDFKCPTAIILGAEDAGISEAALKLSDEKVQIPLQGEIQSLNVSAAAAVLLFEVVRQRREGKR
ncbi:MAG: 23S rRNA (guanosine(2251)-2'-O)-methyltransferase RlmB [Prevotellaceae bacterium]|jgi:23S rRNA (guanosine2251-2'-O)-methyltransferase|nr:23S rRNA (guanosine(2251)-2'-O)-methyltransferase RlmB [Prevotellaceae bacterium]